MPSVSSPDYITTVTDEGWVEVDAITEAFERLHLSPFTEPTWGKVSNK